jgi:uncharacterized protein
MNIQISEIVTGNQLDTSLQAKYEHLRSLFREMERTVIAFSGGVDSTLALKISMDTLGPANTLAVTAISPSLSSEEQREAVQLLRDLGAPYELVETSEVEDPRYAENPANRCYFCKVHVGDALLEVAHQRGFEYIVDGFNRDDTGDHRPGRKAGRERGIRSPLYEAEMTKADVRQLARHLDLPNWNKPAMACLSSRVPYGSSITPAILKQIDTAETALRHLGFDVLRVRHHDKLARVEVPVEDIPAVIHQRDDIVNVLLNAGYIYVTLDLQGFRSGSMNEALTNGG